MTTKTEAAKPAATIISDTDRGTAPLVLGTASALDTSGPANIPAATEFTPSGAPRQVTDIDVDHPAVDNDPRAGTTVDQNRIDFNDPVRTGCEIAEAASATPAKAA